MHVWFRDSHAPETERGKPSVEICYAAGVRNLQGHELGHGIFLRGCSGLQGLGGMCSSRAWGAVCLAERLVAPVLDLPVAVSAERQEL